MQLYFMGILVHHQEVIDGIHNKIDLKTINNSFFAELGLIVC